jgi:apolipoprotein N-acyltransferase
MKLFWKILIVLSIVLSLISILVWVLNKQEPIEANWIAIFAAVIALFCGIVALFIGELLYFNIQQMTEATKATAEKTAKDVAIKTIKEDTEKLTQNAVRDIVNDDIEKRLKLNPYVDRIFFDIYQRRFKGKNFPNSTKINFKGIEDIIEFVKSYDETK